LLRDQLTRADADPDTGAPSAHARDVVAGARGCIACAAGGPTDGGEFTGAGLIGIAIGALIAQDGASARVRGTLNLGRDQANPVLFEL
jgi:hypothetical protein